MSWILLTAVGVGLAAGTVIGRLTTLPTLHLLRGRLAAQRHDATHDRLTGVLNRAGLEDAYTDGAGHDRYLLIVDLDDFKAVNDRHGHPAGDRVLATVGARLAGLAAAHHGVAGRLGGDEFALLLPAAAGAGTERVAAAAAASLTLGDLRTGWLQVTGSTGIAPVPAHTPFADALTCADIALYHAKQRGGVASHVPGMAYPKPPAPRRRARDARHRR